MRKIFIADAHLKNPEDSNYRRLLEFLATLAGNCDTLYILGDLFEFWIGYRRVPFKHYFPIMEALLQLRRQGASIVFFEGNHDFHMGPFFTEELRAEVHAGPAIIDLAGRRAYLCHGDQINKADYGYRLLRALFRSRLTKTLVRVVPPPLVSQIAISLGNKSKQKHSRNNRVWDYPAILRDFAAQRFADGCDMVITGHFHIPLMESDEVGGKTLVALGDWITQFSYAEWEDGAITLKKY